MLREFWVHHQISSLQFQYHSTSDTFVLDITNSTNAINTNISTLLDFFGHIFQQTCWFLMASVTKWPSAQMMLWMGLSISRGEQRRAWSESDQRSTIIPISYICHSPSSLMLTICSTVSSSSSLQLFYKLGLRLYGAKAGGKCRTRWGGHWT